jgi:hypothetical protein
MLAMLAEVQQHTFWLLLWLKQHSCNAAGCQHSCLVQPAVARAALNRLRWLSAQHCSIASRQASGSCKIDGSDCGLLSILHGAADKMVIMTLSLCTCVMQLIFFSHINSVGVNSNSSHNCKQACLGYGAKSHAMPYP